MKIVCIGDLQMHKYSRFPETDSEGVNLRLLDKVNELGRIRRLCTKNRVEVVCILGDIFEARNSLEVNVLNATYNAFQDYATHGIRLILLVGNHDRTDVGREHALEVFKPFCEVVDSPTTLRFSHWNIVAVPFHPSARSVRNAIRKCVTQDTRILLLHTAVKTLKMPNGKTWGEGIDLEDIPKHVLCLMGHYHRWHELRTNKVFYLGSLMEENQGDASIAKYYAVYDSERGKVDFHLSSGPKFIGVDVDELPSEKMTPATLLALEQHYAALVRGNFVTVKSIPQDCMDLGAVERYMIQCEARHVEFALKTQFPSSPPKILPESYNDPVHMDVIKTYVEDTETSLDKEQLVMDGVDIVQQVISENTGVNDRVVEV